MEDGNPAGRLHFPHCFPFTLFTGFQNDFIVENEQTNPDLSGPTGAENIYPGRHTDTQTQTQTHRHTHRQTDRHTDTQRHTHTHTQTHTHVCAEASGPAHVRPQK